MRACSIPSQDFHEHAKLCDALMSHYHSTYLDRRVYYAARDRAECIGDMLTCIVDTFDKSKVSIPQWPLRRAPKRAVFEKFLRHLD